jgi:DNA polymerase-1
MNSPIQGTAADIIKIAMINVNRELKDKKYDARLILQVHDELLIESNKNCSDDVMKLLVECMENAVKLSVPLNVEAKIGQTWYETK